MWGYTGVSGLALRVQSLELGFGVQEVNITP